MKCYKYHYFKSPSQKKSAFSSFSYNERHYNLSNYYGMIPLVSHTYWHIYKINGEKVVGCKQVLFNGV